MDPIVLEASMMIMEATKISNVIWRLAKEKVEPYELLKNGTKFARDGCRKIQNGFAW
jgi:hypothetical protein